MVASNAQSRAAETACTLILIGLILQVIEVVVLVAVGLILLIAPLLGGIVLVAAFFSIVWVVLIYVFSYSRATDGDYDGARTPTLVFGILSLLGFNLISGILYIVAYAKLGDAEPEWPVQPTPAWGGSPLLAASRYCTACGGPNASTSAFCATCGTPLPQR